MSAFNWFQAVFMVVIVALVPFGVFLWRTARKAGEQDLRRDDAVVNNEKEITGLGDRLQRDIKRVEALGEEKVDCATFDAFQERVLMRLDYLDKRVDETSAITTQRIDKESGRFSDFMGKITKWNEDFREDLSRIRERLIRLEPKPK